MPDAPRTIAIGDIHGCLNALETLLKAIPLQPTDRLITLGDYVDRGPDSREVLDRIISLHDAGRLIALRGNHELMMVRAREAFTEERFWRSFGGLNTLDSYAPPNRPGRLNDVPDRHWQFMVSDCLDWFDTETHIFVHAGVDPLRHLDDQTEEALFWQPLVDRGPHLSRKIVICGHTEQREGEPLDLGHTVCIDTFAYGGGWLTGLDVASGEYWQANEKGRSRGGELGQWIS